MHTAEDDDIYERPRSKKGKPPHPRAYSEDADDAEEDDPGHMESQSVLPQILQFRHDADSALREFLKTTKTPAKNPAAAQPNGNLTGFQKVVETRKTELGKLLQDKAREVYARPPQPFWISISS